MSICLPSCKFPFGNKQLGLSDESPFYHPHLDHLDPNEELEDDVSLLVRYSDECLSVETPRKVEVVCLEKMFMEVRSQRKTDFTNVAAELVQDLVLLSAAGIATKAIAKAEAKAKAVSAANSVSKANAIIEAEEKDMPKVKFANVAAEFVQDMILLAAERIAKEAVGIAEAENKAEDEADVKARDVYGEAVAVADAKLLVKSKVDDVLEAAAIDQEEDDLNLFCADYINDVLSAAKAQLLEESLNTCTAKLVSFSFQTTEECSMKELELRREELFCKEYATDAIFAAQAQLLKEQLNVSAGEFVAESLQPALQDSQRECKDTFKKETVQIHELETKITRFCREYVTKVMIAAQAHFKELNIFTGNLVTESLHQAKWDCREGGDSVKKGGNIDHELEALFRGEYVANVTSYTKARLKEERPSDFVSVVVPESLQQALNVDVEVHEVEERKDLFYEEYVEDVILNTKAQPKEEQLNIFARELVAETCAVLDTHKGDSLKEEVFEVHELDEREDLLCKDFVDDVILNTKAQLKEEQLSIFARELVAETCAVLNTHKEDSLKEEVVEVHELLCKDNVDDVTSNTKVHSKEEQINIFKSELVPESLHQEACHTDVGDSFVENVVEDHNLKESEGFVLDEFMADIWSYNDKNRDEHLMSFASELVPVIFCQDLNEDVKVHKQEERGDVFGKDYMDDDISNTKSQFNEKQLDIFKSEFVPENFHHDACYTDIGDSLKEDVVEDRELQESNSFGSDDFFADIMSYNQKHRDEHLMSFASELVPVIFRQDLNEDVKVHKQEEKEDIFGKDYVDDVISNTKPQFNEKQLNIFKSEFVPEYFHHDACYTDVGDSLKEDVVEDRELQESNSFGSDDFFADIMSYNQKHRDEHLMSFANELVPVIFRQDLNEDVKVHKQEEREDFFGKDYMDDDISNTKPQFNKKQLNNFKSEFVPENFHHDACSTDIGDSLKEDVVEDRELQESNSFGSDDFFADIMSYNQKHRDEHLMSFANELVPVIFRQDLNEDVKDHKQEEREDFFGRDYVDDVILNTKAHFKEEQLNISESKFVPENFHHDACYTDIGDSLKEDVVEDRELQESNSFGSDDFFADIMSYNQKHRDEHLMSFANELVPVIFRQDLNEDVKVQKKEEREDVSGRDYVDDVISKTNAHFKEEHLNIFESEFVPESFHHEACHTDVRDSLAENLGEDHNLKKSEGFVLDEFMADIWSYNDKNRDEHLMSFASELVPVIFCQDLNEDMKVHEQEEREDLFCKEFVNDVLSNAHAQIQEEQGRIFSGELEAESVPQVLEEFHEEGSLTKGGEVLELEEREDLFCELFVSEVISHTKAQLAEEKLSDLVSEVVIECLRQAVKETSSQMEVEVHELEKREDLFYKEFVNDVLLHTNAQLQEEHFKFFINEFVSETLHQALQNDPLERDETHVTGSRSAPKQVTFSDTIVFHKVSSTYAGLRKRPKRTRPKVSKVPEREDSQEGLEAGLRKRPKRTRPKVSKVPEREDSQEGLEELFQDSAIQQMMVGRRIKRVRTRIGDLARAIIRAALHPFRRSRPRTRKEATDPGGITLSNSKLQRLTAPEARVDTRTGPSKIVTTRNGPTSRGEGRTNPTNQDSGGKKCRHLKQPNIDNNPAGLRKISAKRMEPSSTGPGASKGDTAEELHGDAEVTNKNPETVPKPLKRSRTRRFLEQVGRPLTELWRPFVTSIRG